MKIHFKNEESKEVVKEVGEAIKEKIQLLNGVPEFLSFSDKQGNLLLIINMREVTYID